MIPRGATPASGVATDMAATRSGTTKHKRWRDAVLHAAQRDGITHCPRCGMWLDYNRSLRPNSAEADHILAHADGGKLTLDNGRVMCRRCNQQLGAETAQRRREARRQPQRVTNIDFRRA